MDERENKREIRKGIGLLLLLHNLLWIFPIAFTLIGLTQWIYALPAYFIMKRKNRPGMAQGIIMGAGITFLLNTACWGVFFVALMSSS